MLSFLSRHLPPNTTTISPVDVAGSHNQFTVKDGEMTKIGSPFSEATLEWLENFPFMEHVSMLQYRESRNIGRPSAVQLSRAPRWFKHPMLIRISWSIVKHLASHSVSHLEALDISIGVKRLPLPFQMLDELYVLDRLAVYLLLGYDENAWKIKDADMLPHTRLKQLAVTINMSGFTIFKPAPDLTPLMSSFLAKIPKTEVITMTRLYPTPLDLTIFSTVLYLRSLRVYRYRSVTGEQPCKRCHIQSSSLTELFISGLVSMINTLSNSSVKYLSFEEGRLVALEEAQDRDISISDEIGSL